MPKTLDLLTNPRLYKHMTHMLHLSFFEAGVYKVTYVQDIENRIANQNKRALRLDRKRPQNLVDTFNTLLDMQKLLLIKYPNTSLPQFRGNILFDCEETKEQFTQELNLLNSVDETEHRNQIITLLDKWTGYPTKSEGIERIIPIVAWASINKVFAIINHFGNKVYCSIENLAEVYTELQDLTPFSYMSLSILNHHNAVTEPNIIILSEDGTVGVTDTSKLYFNGKPVTITSRMYKDFNKTPTKLK
jgi:hypothetical protein